MSTSAHPQIRSPLFTIYLICSVTKVVVCYLLNKRVATFTIVSSYCQQTAEHSAPVIPQSIRGQIPHSVFHKVFSPPQKQLSVGGGIIEIGLLYISDPLAELSTNSWADRCLKEEICYSLLVLDKQYWDQLQHVPYFTFSRYDQLVKWSSHTKPYNHTIQ